jgi:uncharacterized protein (DUF2164 family)
MSINLPKDKKVQLVESIKHYFEENMDTQIGELKASLLLDYFIIEIGPSIYNQAILDAQAVMTDKINDLDSSCYLPEFMYWKE